MINADLKNRINEIYQQGNSSGKLTAFENVPPKKLRSAVQSYASVMGNDETVIFLYDDTVFGSAKEGFLLTSKRLYQKNIMEKGSFLDVANIINMKFGKEGIVSSIYANSMKIDITQVVDDNGKRAVFNVLSSTIKLLVGGGTSQAVASTPAQAAMPRSTACGGCGAMLSPQSAACEYCGKIN